jgi:hypothetical protein
MASSADFKQVLDEMWDLHQKKNKDYGAKEDPYRNVRSSADWGIDPWIGALIRGNDKIQRLKTYAQTHQLANEGAEDSLIDLAVYSVIALVLWREQYKEKMEQKTFTPVEKEAMEQITGSRYPLNVKP